MKEENNKKHPPKINDECLSLMSDVDSYSKEEYLIMEEDLANKINFLISSTEKKYNVQPLIDTIKSKTRVEVFILNKVSHNL